MKRALALLMILMMLCLAACQKAEEPAPVDAHADEGIMLDDYEPEPDDIIDEPATQTAQAETPDEAPPTAAPAIPTNITYTTDQQTDWRLSYKYPELWVDKSTALTLIYEEPVEQGIVPARMAITKKDAGQIVVTVEVGMDKLDAFGEQLKSASTNFKMKRGKQFSFAGNTGIRFTYTGDFNGVPMQGYAALAYAPKKKMFFLFHFSAPADRYANYNNIRKTLIAGVESY